MQGISESSVTQTHQLNYIGVDSLKGVLHSAVMIQTNPNQPFSTVHHRPPSTQPDAANAKTTVGVFQLLMKVDISCMPKRQGSVYKIIYD